jgi:hypothetical protein
VADDVKAESTLNVLCPLCSELYEVTDPRLVLLAQHLAQHCDETQGLLHD